MPIELQADHLKIEPDHVLADMLRAMHMTVVPVSEAFEPENGAYGEHGGSSHGHGHSHAQDSDHSHTHGSHAPAPQAAPKRVAIPIRAAHAEPHVHGPDCKHEH